jgi:uncharacterized protein (DUF2267 family)
MDAASHADLIQSLRRLGPFDDDDAAESALSAVLRALGRRLLPEERRSVASRLPQQCARILEQPGAAEGNGLLRVVLELAEVERVSAGQAAEHLDIVVRALEEVAGPDARRQLVRAVPELERLYEARESTDAVAERPPAHGPSDLAEGVEGARNSLASGDPGLLAHRHSVARSDDPHGDSKLSSARGLMQERDDETLASGRPGSRRPISSGH